MCFKSMYISRSSVYSKNMYNADGVHLGLYILRVHICAEGICILSSYISQGSAAYIMGSNVCAWLVFFPFCVEFAILGSSLFWVTAVDYAVASSCISRYIIRGVKKKEMMT